LSEYRNADLVSQILKDCAPTPPIFGFIDPWAVHQRLEQPILSRIRIAGFRLTNLKYARLGRAEAEQIYRKNKPHGETLAWHVPDTVYLTGMSLGFLLTPASAQADFTTLKQLKGFSDPARNEAGSIRCDFRAPNKSLALLHTSDDPASSISEALTFFSPDELRASASGKMGALPSSQVKIYCDSNGPSEIFGPIAATQLLAKIRLRLFGISNLDLNIDKIRSLWLDYIKIDFSNISVGDERARYIAALDQEKLALAALPILPFRAGPPKRWYVHSRWDSGRALCILYMISNSEEYNQIDTSCQNDLMSLCYDKWEELILKTTFFHW
jgi:nucleoside diphosphate kinase